MTSPARYFVVPLLVVYLAALAGCSTAHTAPTAPITAGQWHATPDTISLTPLHGWSFDGLAEQRDRKRGDGVLFEVVVEWPGSRDRENAEQFLVEATFLDIANEGVMRVRTKSAEGEPRRLELPGTDLYIGWAEITEGVSPSSPATYATGVVPEWGTRAGAVEAHQAEADGTPIDNERMLGFYAYGMSAGLLLSNNELCQRLLMKIAARPSLLSIATNLGVDISVHTSSDQPAEEITILLDGHRFEGLRQPMQITANGKPAVLLDVYAAPIRGPLGVSNGTVLIEARHPTDPNRRATLRLAGTRAIDLEEGDLPPSTIVGWESPRSPPPTAPAPARTPASRRNTSAAGSP